MSVQCSQSGPAVRRVSSPAERAALNLQVQSLIFDDSFLFHSPRFVPSEQRLVSSQLIESPLCAWCTKA